jgi:rhodanese-related sulfurtransferase
MKRKSVQRVVLAFVVCAATVLASSAVSFSQSMPGDVVVDVPFAFVVARQHLPAGRYIVAMQADSVKIFQPKGRSIFVPTRAGWRSDDDGSNLVFHRYGDTYFLSVVCIGGRRTTREIFHSSAERELAGQSEMELAVVRAPK